MSHRSWFVSLSCVVVAACLLFALTPAPALAACPASFPVTVPASDTARLIEVIGCANATPGNDVIDLTSSTYILSSIASDATGLPPIVTTATGGTLTINGNGATIARSSTGGTPDFRLFLLNSGANLTLNQMTLRNGRSGLGGGILNNGTLRLTEVSVESNTATTGGGGIFNSGANTVTLHRSAVINNTANSYGGGIANAGGTLHVINSTISGNSALGTSSSSGGGAIDSYGTAPAMSFYNSTITNNTAVAPNTAKSGIWMEAGTAGYFNNIIANNNGANNCFFPFPAFWTYVSNIDNGNSCGFTVGPLNNTDPLLFPLANNGGPTQTHALRPGSPAINNGSNDYAVEEDDSTPLTTDQRGAGSARIRGTSVDIGAFESACFGSPYTIPAGDTQALIDAINCANSTTANDTIALTNSNYLLTTDQGGGNGLPSIVSTATGGTLTINGNGATIERDINAPVFRLLRVAPGGDLRVNFAELLNGNAGSGVGGAIYNEAGALTLTRVDASANSANGGGALFNGGGTLTVRNSSIFFNNAFSFGGGLASSGGTFNLINSTVSGNAANGTSSGSGGGAVDLYGGTTALISQSTITANTAAIAERSGVWHESGTLTIRNSIVANNNGANNCAFTGGTRTDSGGNLDNGTTCGFTGAIGQNTDPLLSSFGSFGGFTLMHALQAGSPAINGGINANATDETGAALTLDQRGTGFARIIGGTVDSGAFEAACPAFPYTVPAGDVNSLIFAIACANSTTANDVITLTNSTYTLTRESAFEIGLPPIVATATGGTLTINGNGATITRSSAVGTPNFKHFQIQAGANLTLNRVTLTNGHAQVGGAIYSDGVLTLSTSTIRDNYAFAGGAISSTGGATITIRNSLIANNRAEQYGGAFDQSAGTLFIINSTLSGNQQVGVDAGYGGGGIDAYNSAVLLISSSTITGNSSPQTARSGIWFEAGSGTLTIRNSIVANNNGANNCLIESGATLTDSGGNLDNGTSCGFGANSRSNATANLGALANNGGQTHTHALLPGSQAINGGINANATDQNGTALSTDQRGTGFARIIGGTVDVGAFEAACPAFPYTVPAGDVNSLIFAIGCANSTTANDVITLTNSTYTLTTPVAFEPGVEVGLPPIAPTAAGGTLTINGAGATIQRSSADGIPDFGLFNITVGANLTLNRVTLAHGARTYGGAIFSDGRLTITDSTLRENFANTSGGAIAATTEAIVVVRNSLLVGNQGNEYSGAIDLFAGTLYLINSTISGNQQVAVDPGYGGGAIGSYSGSNLTIINSTITNNTSSQAARSGVWHEGGTLTIRNSIIAGNNGANNCSIVGSTYTESGNIDNGTSCGFSVNSLSNTNPLLAALANNGGSTQTHALQAGSPAINGGINANATDQTGATLTTDQRGTGFPRIRLGTVDVGAFEAACPTFPYTVPASNSAALIDAIACANATPANDVITLTNSTYTLTADLGGETGLPQIASTATGGTLTINGNGATIQRSSADGTPGFRIMRLDSNANVTLNQVTLANGSVDYGGAIYNNAGTLTLNRVELRDNRAYAGGAIYNDGGTVTVRDSTIRGNTVTGFGGGIASNGGSLWIVNSTLSGNAANSTASAEGGGAVDFFGSTNALISQSTITNNTAVAPNAARSGIWQESGTLTLRNSIIAGNNGANNCAFTGGTRTDSGGNLDNGTSCGFGANSRSNATANLAALANNGGPTLTHALLPGSQAINGGINANATDQTGATLTTDQRGTGFARINNTTVDSGATESNVSALDVILSMQGRSALKPHSSYAVSVRVTIMPSGGGAAFYDQTVMSSANGTFTIPNLPPGTYLFRFKGAHTLAVQQVLTIGPGFNGLETFILREGDANNDNVITISDFSLLAAAFGKATGQVGFDARADFNQDGAVTVADFALLAANFGQVGAS